MFPNRIDFADRRARMHQRAISCNQIFKRNLVLDRLLDNRGTASAEKKNDQCGRILRVEQFQNCACRVDRFPIRRGMSALEISKAMYLGGSLNRTRDDAFERR